MTFPIRFPLNPADRLLLELHLSLQERGYCGLNVLLLADIEGPLEPTALNAAAQRVGRAFPSLSARITYSRIWPRARHQIDPDSDPAQSIAYDHLKLSEAEVLPALNRLLNHRFEVARGPLMILRHLEISRTRHKLALVWAHSLMDLEGAHKLLIELDNALNDLPPAMSPDLNIVPPPAMSYFSFRRHYLNWRGIFRRFGHAVLNARTPAEPPAGADRSAGYVLRAFSPDETRRFEQLAKQRVAPGEMLYTRYFIASVVRACIESPPSRSHAAPGPRLFSHVEPLRHHRPRRGIHGNYLTIPWFKVDESQSRSWPEIDAALSPQVLEYRTAGQIEADWCGMSDLTLYPGPALRRLMRRRASRATSSLTSYTFGDSPTTLGQARITNLACAGTMSRDPGIMVARSTFADSMSISVSYFTDYLGPEPAAAFLARLEARMLGEQ